MSRRRRRSRRREFAPSPRGSCTVNDTPGSAELRARHANTHAATRGLGSSAWARCGLATGGRSNRVAWLDSAWLGVARRDDDAARRDATRTQKAWERLSLFLRSGASATTAPSSLAVPSPFPPRSPALSPFSPSASVAEELLRVFAVGQNSLSPFSAAFAPRLLLRRLRHASILLLPPPFSPRASRRRRSVLGCRVRAF